MIGNDRIIPENGPQTVAEKGDADHGRRSYAARVRKSLKSSASATSSKSSRASS